MIQIEEQGQRLYITGDTFPILERIRQLDAHWDRDRRAWWVGKAKRLKLEAMIQEVTVGVGEATAASKRYAKQLGMEEDTPANIVADKLQDAGRDSEAATIRSGGDPRPDPAKIEIGGKCLYKDKSYYFSAKHREHIGIKTEQRVDLFTLPDDNGDFINFRAPGGALTLVREYAPRQPHGRRYGFQGRERYVYPTLASLAAFAQKQRDPNAVKRVRCPECDAWHNENEPCHECGGG